MMIPFLVLNHQERYFPPLTLELPSSYFSVLPQLNWLGQQEETHRREDPWGKGAGTSLKMIREINIV